MKKLLSLLILFSLVTSFFIPAAVFAAGANEPESVDSPQANCTHTEYGYTKSYYYSYTRLNGSYHEVYKTEKRTCKNCQIVYYTGSPEALPMEKHSGTFKVDKNVHIGDPSTHYYTKTGTCYICRGRAEFQYSTGCTASRCNEIASVGRPEIK